MDSAKERRHFTGQEKLAILQRHLVEKVPVSDLCEEHGLHPTVFYRWQKDLFEHAAAGFDSSNGRGRTGSAKRAEDAASSPNGIASWTRDASGGGPRDGQRAQRRWPDEGGAPRPLLAERRASRTTDALGGGYRSALKQPERRPRGQDRKAGDGFVPRTSVSDPFRDWHPSEESAGRSPASWKKEYPGRRSPGSS